MRWRQGMAIALLGLGGAGTAGGCAADPGESCENLDCEIINPDGTSNGTCEGYCVPPAPGGFEDPVFLKTVAFDKQEKLPSCGEALPHAAPNLYKAAYRRPTGSPDCPPCPCGAPACELPAGLTANSRFMCSGDPGAITTPLEAPAGWDGSCISPGAVPPEQLASYEVPAATVRPCAPLDDAPPVYFEGGGDQRMPEPWTEGLMSCKPVAVVPSICGEEGDRCLFDQDHHAEGWQICVLSTDPTSTTCPVYDATQPDMEPAGGRWYSEPVTYYANLGPKPECSPCTCHEAEPSTCEAFVSTYEDDQCRTLINTTLVTEDAGACTTAPPDTELRSLSAAWRVNTPGRCEPGERTAVGDYQPADPLFFCCIPERANVPWGGGKR